jgi:hypothetical protein
MILRRGLKVECTACGAATTLSGIEVAQRDGSKAALDHLRARLKCKRCRMKAED